MEPIISLCGMRCDLCLAYRSNIEENPENRKIISDGWHTYFGFRIPPEQVFCNGCLPNNNTTLDRDCAVRPCVIENNLPNCAYCDQYICQKLADVLIDFDSLQAQFGKPIPAEDRNRFIFPYENKQRLDAIRCKK